jgi:predicted RecB family endonuclease
MGASGADILLSPAARRLFPFYVEAKNRETINIWEAIRQASTGAGKAVGVHPLVVFRRNNSPTYAALPFDLLLELLKEVQYVDG